VSWLNILRLVDMAAIGLSAGFAVSLWWVLGSWRIGWPLRVARAAFLISYLMYASVAMVELEAAIYHDLPFTLRTVVATAAAIVGVYANWWAWLHWEVIADQMSGEMQIDTPKTLAPVPVKDRMAFEDKTALVYVALVVVSALAIGAMSFGLWHQQQDIEKLQIAGAAQRLNLCREIEGVKDIQRQRIQEDIQASQEFLRDNPRGIPGIPAELIHQANDRRRAQLQGITVEVCPSE